MPSLVSIVMPVYNMEQYIKEAINSVLAQTFTNWELIIIDDGSTDQTANIIASYKDKRIHYFYQENKGQSNALNHGINIISGDSHSLSISKNGIIYGWGKNDTGQLGNNNFENQFLPIKIFKI